MVSPPPSPGTQPSCNQILTLSTQKQKAIMCSEHETENTEHVQKKTENVLKMHQFRCLRGPFWNPRMPFCWHWEPQGILKVAQRQKHSFSGLSHLDTHFRTCAHTIDQKSIFRSLCFGICGQRTLSPDKYRKAVGPGP